MATHSNILAWKIPWTEEPGRLQSWGCKELDKQLREVPAVGGVCIRGKRAGIQQGCGGGNESGLCQRRWREQSALLGGGVVTLAGYPAGGIQVLPPGASLPLYTALGLPQLLVLPP